MPASVSTPFNTPVFACFGGRASEVSLCVKVSLCPCRIQFIGAYCDSQRKEHFGAIGCIVCEGAYHRLLFELLPQDMKLGQQTR